MEKNKEYYISRNKIKISPVFRNHRIREEKFFKKIVYWCRTGEFESQIILDNNYNLMDGYSSFRIAELNNMSKVPVQFVEEIR